MIDDKHDDDESVSPLEALVEKSPELQRLLIEAAAAADILDWDQEQASLAGNGSQMPERTATAGRPSHVYEPFGTRQRKKAARRVLFDRLRAGASREAACAAAGISVEMLQAWMDRPEFRESIMQAEGFRHLDEYADW